MKYVLFLIVLYSYTSYAQNNCNIIEAYDQIFSLKTEHYKDDMFFVKEAKTINYEHCYADFVNNNHGYLNYLLINFSNYFRYTELKLGGDSLELQQTFIKKLSSDSLFNAQMLLLEKKHTLKDGFKPDTLSINEVLNVAVKFFSVIGITDRGHYQGKVCTGINKN